MIFFCLLYKEEGKVAAAHAAATKEYLLLEDVQHDSRFAEGLKWVDAKVALCMPVVKPDGDCYAVLELYRTNAEPYDHVCYDNIKCISLFCLSTYRYSKIIDIMISIITLIQVVKFGICPFCSLNLLFKWINHFTS